MSSQIINRMILLHTIILLFPSLVKYKLHIFVRLTSSLGDISLGGETVMEEVKVPSSPRIMGPTDTDGQDMGQHRQVKME